MPDAGGGGNAALGWAALRKEEGGEGNTED